MGGHRQPHYRRMRRPFRVRPVNDWALAENPEARTASYGYLCYYATAYGSHLDYPSHPRTRLRTRGAEGLAYRAPSHVPQRERMNRQRREVDRGGIPPPYPKGCKG